MSQANLKKAEVYYGRQACKITNLPETVDSNSKEDHTTILNAIEKSIGLGPINRDDYCIEIGPGVEGYGESHFVVRRSDNAVIVTYKWNTPYYNGFKATSLK